MIILDISVLDGISFKRVDENETNRCKFEDKIHLTQKNIFIWMCVRWQQETVILVWVGLFYVGHDHNMIVTVISFYIQSSPLPP